MMSFAELKSTSTEERRAMLKSFTSHPLTKFTGAVMVTVASKIATNLVVDKIEERMDRKKEIEE